MAAAANQVVVQFFVGEGFTHQTFSAYEVLSKGIHPTECTGGRSQGTTQSPQGKRNLINGARGLFRSLIQSGIFELLAQDREIGNGIADIFVVGFKGSA